MKKRLKGKIVSIKMNKTAVVAVSRYFKHPKYKKYINRSKKYKAHNEENKYKEKEEVFIESCRPLSKDKHFRIIGYAKESPKSKVQISNQIQNPND